MNRMSTLLLKDKKKEKKVTMFDRLASGWMPTSEIAIYKHGEVPIEWFLDARKDRLCFVDQNNEMMESFAYSDMDYVNFSLVCRGHSPDGRASLSYHYPVLLDVCIKGKIIPIEIFYPHSLQNVIDTLIENNVDCVDMVGVIDIYKNYPDIYSRDRYLRMQYASLAKKYGLDYLK